MEKYAARRIKQAIDRVLWEVGPDRLDRTRASRIVCTERTKARLTAFQSYGCDFVVNNHSLSVQLHGLLASNFESEGVVTRFGLWRLND